MDPVAIIAIVVLVGIFFLIGVITSVKQNKLPALSNRLLIILIVIGVMFVVFGGLLIAALSIDAWFYRESSIIIGHSPFFLGWVMIISGALMMSARKSHTK